MARPIIYYKIEKFDWCRATNVLSYEKALRNVPPHIIIQGRTMNAKYVFVRYLTNVSGKKFACFMIAADTIFDPKFNHELSSFPKVYIPCLDSAVKRE